LEEKQILFLFGESPDMKMLKNDACKNKYAFPWPALPSQTRIDFFLFPFQAPDDPTFFTPQLKSQLAHHPNHTSAQAIASPPPSR